MKRSSRTLLLLAATLTTTLSGLTILEAGCHGNYGRRVYSSHSYPSRPVYSQPYYSHEVVSQPVYVSPQPEVVYESSPYTTPPLTSSRFGVQVQSGMPVEATPISLNQQVQTSPTGLPLGLPSQGTFQPGTAPQVLPQSVGAQPGTVPLAGQSTQPVGQPGGQPAVLSPNGLPQNATVGTSVPVNAATPVAAPTSTAPVSTASAAELSALQALGGFAPPQAEATAAPPQAQTLPTAPPAHVGTWSASMPNGARVQLTLNADGTFSWSAINSAGNASTFQGSYQFDGTTLTLNRSNDSQKLVGSVIFNGAAAFNFKMSDAQAGSLAFARS